MFDENGTLEELFAAERAILVVANAFSAADVDIEKYLMDNLKRIREIQLERLDQLAEYARSQVEALTQVRYELTTGKEAHNGEKA